MKNSIIDILTKDDAGILEKYHWDSVYDFINDSAVKQMFDKQIINVKFYSNNDLNVKNLFNICNIYQNI